MKKRKVRHDQTLLGGEHGAINLIEKSQLRDDIPDFGATQGQGSFKVMSTVKGFGAFEGVVSRQGGSTRKRPPRK